MSNKYIEKSFLFLLVISLLLHMAAAAFLYYLPEQQPPAKEPVFVDLQQIPEFKAQEKPRTKPAPRVSDQRRRVEREAAPRGSDFRERPVAVPSAPPVRPQQRVPQREAAGAAPPREAPASQPALPRQAERRENQVAPGSSAASLLKPKQSANRQQSPPQLFPGSDKMAKLEENYRRKFESNIAEGDTRFLNTDDIQFGSFLRRFENSVYGVWRYPAEAARNGIEGITPIKITFNRNGEIVKIQQLESSGSRILDDEVIRTLRSIGPIGSFPKGYDKDEFNLIAFFQYGGARRALH
ncbi:MAG TPA: TonB family protein [Desulfuromonadaceae bacterium]|jgi:protein TonB